MNATVKKPDVFRYDRCGKFLRDWLHFLRAQGRKISAERASLNAGLSKWYLGKVLNGQKNLTVQALHKLKSPLELSHAQIKFLTKLIELEKSKDEKESDEALSAMYRHKEFQLKNLDSVATHQYLSNWYYPVIREMVDLPEFKLDAQWIRRRLKYKVPKSDITACLNYLIANNYIEVQKDGRVRSHDVSLECAPGIHKAAMAKFHSQMLDLAAKTIYVTPQSERMHLSYTVSLSSATLPKVREILERALNDIVSLSQSEKPAHKDDVYQFHLVGHPLSAKKDS